MASVRRRNPTDDDDQDEVQPTRLPVRRDPLSVSIQPMEDAGLTSEVLDLREHQGNIISVTSQVSVGIDQRIRLAWSVPPSYYIKGYRLLGYRRTQGFAPENSRWDLSVHGTKVIDARTDGEKEELLAEGEYFYSFLLHRTALLGCVAMTRDLVQFSEMIPSAKHAIQRLEDTLKARTLVKKLLDMSGRQRKDEPANGVSIARLLADERREVEEVKATPEWKALSKDDRGFVLGAIRERYRKMIGRG